MIKFSAIEYEHGTPGAIIYTNDFAGVKELRYVLEVQTPDPVFKPGQIVRVVGGGFLGFIGRYGVVKGRDTVGVTVDIGNVSTVSFSSYHLEIIHEVA